MQLKALLFDVDGTLADTERDGHRVAFNMAFRDAGLDWNWTPQLYGELLAVTGGKERIAFYLEKYRPEVLRTKDLATCISGLHAAKTERYLALLSDGKIPLRPGVARLLDDARSAGIRLAIATTTTPANVSALLQQTLGEESESWFEVIGAGDIVASKKPAPDIYEWVLSQMSLAPGECMVLEDSENGVKSAYDAGLRSILVTVNAYTKQQNFSYAPYVIDHLGDPGVPVHVLRGKIQAPEYIGIDELRRLHVNSVDTVFA